jgi:hypothetical protein
LSHPYPLWLRAAALAWLALFVVVYWRVYGPLNFLHLCDVAVIVTCIGLWRGSALLLSSQALSSLVIDLTWNVDVLWRLLLGRHLLGGTEYMWDPRWPLAVRAMSLFHVVWPPLLLWALRRVRYDRRALLLQPLVAAALLAGSAALAPGLNINFAERDPFVGRQWGPPAVHVALTWAVLVAAIYWPTHRLLVRLFARAEDESAPDGP